jgi:metacaspase-1
MSRKKSLLIGINYTGSQNELRGCHQDVENVAEFLSYRGYSDDPRAQVILRDDARGQYYPNGHNILVLPFSPILTPTSKLKLMIPRPQLIG